MISSHALDIIRLHHITSTNTKTQRTVSTITIPFNTSPVVSINVSSIHWFYSNSCQSLVLYIYIQTINKSIPTKLSEAQYSSVSFFFAQWKYQNEVDRHRQLSDVIEYNGSKLTQTTKGQWKEERKKSKFNSEHK